MSTPQTPTVSAATAHAGKYLTFALGDEEYGIEILKVREIVGCLDITPVPRTEPHVRGVVNLRGQVISVIDLRTAFGMPSVPRTEQTCIIVIEVKRDGRKVACGIVVDRVREVLNIIEKQIEPPPEFGAAVEGGFILGMGKVGDRVKILLDIDAVLGTTATASLRAA